MKKIVSLYQRNYATDRLIRNEVVPGAEWVLVGEGVATRKWDGTCCKVEGGILFKRFDAKHGKRPPPGFIPAQDPDPNTGHWPGWLPVGDGPEDQWHRAAFDNMPKPVSDGTYELLGPKVQGGVEGFPDHTLVAHGRELLPDAPRDFDGLRAYFEANNIEGIVWWRENGDMVKVKAKDYGIKRVARSVAA